MAITVLVVDDSKTSRKMLTDVLTRMGLEVIGEAVNGEEGFLKYKELRPDIVTMDITMPVMNGLESLLLIKHEDENAKVVMITAAGQKNNLMQAVKAGAEDLSSLLPELTLPTPLGSSGVRPPRYRL